MTHPHDRQLEHDLTELGRAWSERAPEQLPEEIASAVTRRRRGVLARRIALAAGIVLVGAGAVVVYFAASAWTPFHAPKPIVRHGSSHDMPESTGAVPDRAASAPSIASLQEQWRLTGEADPPVPSRASEVPIQAGDIANRAKLDSLTTPPR